MGSQSIYRGHRETTPPIQAFVLAPGLAYGLMAGCVAFCMLGCGASESYDQVATEGGSASASVRSANRKSATKLVATQNASVVDRMIVYEAQVTAETEDFDRFATNLSAELAQLGGFIATSSERRVAGDQRAGEWKLRVPSERFTDMMRWLDENANVFRKELKSQDMTDEFVDLTARIANKKNSEQRLVEILHARAGDLDDVLTMEREIDRVREDIERMEGRLQLLSERVALSTIALDVSTRVEYTATKPTFATRLGEAWGGSLTLLSNLGQTATVVAVALAPWLAVSAGILLLIYCGKMVARRVAVKSARPTQTA